MLNDNILYLFNRSIYEYDMKNAGYSLSKAYNLLPNETLDKLGKYKKDRRTIEIGKLQRSDKDFKNNLTHLYKFNLNYNSIYWRVLCINMIHIFTQWRKAWRFA